MDEWIEMLTELEAAMDALLEIAAQKRGVVTKGDIPALEALVRKESGILARISTIEEKRQRSVVVYALRAGIDPKTATLASLIQTIPAGKKKDTLSALHGSMREKIRQLEMSNGINDELLRTQRDIAQFMIESTSRPTQLGIQYSGDGRDADNNDRISILDKDV